MSFNDIYAHDAIYYGTEPSAGLVALLESQGVSTGRALDLGCGEGRDALWLSQRGYAVTALDESEIGIGVMLSHSPEGIEGVVADVMDYAIPTATYDLISAATILDHIDVASSQKLASRIIRGLKSGGLLFAEVFTIDDPGFTGIGAASETSMFVEHYFRPNELRNLFIDLEVIHYAETIKVDRSHGPPHNHGVAVLLARKSA